MSGIPIKFKNKYDWGHAYFKNYFKIIENETIFKILEKLLIRKVLLKGLWDQQTSLTILDPTLSK